MASENIIITSSLNARVFLEWKDPSASGLYLWFESHSWAGLSKTNNAACLRTRQCSHKGPLHASEIYHLSKNLEASQSLLWRNLSWQELRSQFDCTPITNNFGVTVYLLASIQWQSLCLIPYTSHLILMTTLWKIHYYFFTDETLRLGEFHKSTSSKPKIRLLTFVLCVLQIFSENYLFL